MAMKKLTAALCIILILSACNSNTSTSTTTTTDSSALNESPLMDAVNTADSVNIIIHDSTGRSMDTLNRK